MNCVICVKLLTGRQIRFCSKKCKDRQYYLRNKEYMIKRALDWRKNNLEKAKEHCVKSSKKFIKNNPERFKQLMKKTTQKNKHKMKSRIWINNYRKEVFEIIGNKCINCGKKAKHIHHLKYKNLPARKKQNLQEYSKYLEPYCIKCHRKLHEIKNKT